VYKELVAAGAGLQSSFIFTSPASQPSKANMRFITLLAIVGLALALPNQSPNEAASPELVEVCVAAALSVQPVANSSVTA
jgi:hypothetical protein